MLATKCPCEYFTCAHVCGAGEEVNEVNIVQVSKWLLCVYKSMDEFADNSATLADLRSLQMIPLSSGRVTSAGSDTIFFPVALSSEKRGCCLWLLCLLPIHGMK